MTVEQRVRDGFKEKLTILIQKLFVAIPLIQNIRETEKEKQ